MDSRRVSAAFGFTLLIICVAGVAYLIHNSGSTRLTPPPTGPAVTRLSSSFGRGNASWGNGNGRRGKEGYMNDPNYRNSQPTLQEVNELADELQRLLQSKPPGKKVTAVNGVVKPSQSQKAGGQLKNVTGKPASIPAGESRPASPPPQNSSKNRASISAVNYSSVPNRVVGGETEPHANHLNPAEQNVGESVGPLRSSPVPRQPHVQQEHRARPHDLHQLSWQGATPVAGNINDEVGVHRYPHLDYQTAGSHEPGKPPLHHFYQHLALPVGSGARPPAKGKDKKIVSDNASSLMELLADAAKQVVASDADDEEEEEEDEAEEEEEYDYKDPLESKQITAQLDTLYQLASNLFSSANQSTLQGFLKVVNETIQRGNSSRLLQQLNEVYVQTRATSGNGALSPSNSSSGLLSHLNPSLFKSTNESHKPANIQNLSKPYETSLTAFVFMTFGVFLLNQIHSFVQGSSTRSFGHNQPRNSFNFGRSFPESLLAAWLQRGLSDAGSGEPLMLSKEPSSLDILFEEPGSSQLATNETKQADNIPPASSSLQPIAGWEADDERRNFNDGDVGVGEKHANNLFRGLLNIVNAYMSNGKAMECIWSLYCTDLDSTAKKQGLYGVAARINSVGLRLIMNQIPPSLAMDVMLRSLVGWDGLPCHKMFPECAVGNGTISLIRTNQSATLQERRSGKPF